MSVFISYRRAGGYMFGQFLYYRLKEDGYEVFFDTESMKSGRFDEQIIEQIGACSVFLLVLTPNALDRCVQEGDFVRLEITQAMSRKKRIIPILAEGFQFPETLPEEIDAVRFYQGVHYDPNFAEAFYQKLLDYMKEGTSPEGEIDIYASLRNAFGDLFARREPPAPAEARAGEKEEPALPDAGMMRPDAAPKAEWTEAERTFSVLEKPAQTILCFQAGVKTVTANSESTSVYYLKQIFPIREEKTEKGRKLVFEPEDEWGGMRQSILFAVIKEDGTVMLRGAEFIQGYLTLARTPSVIRPTSAGADDCLPKDWSMEGLVDCSEFDEHAEEMVCHSPFSVQSLSILLIDPYEKKVITPKLVRGKDGRPWLQLTLLRHRSYCAVGIHSRF